MNAPAPSPNYRRDPNERWYEYAFRVIRETWTYVRRRPHYGFSLAPVNAGVLLLTPSMIEVALRAMDVIADDAVPAWLLVFTQMLGGVCILASIPLFVFFELRTQRVAPTPRGGSQGVSNHHALAPRCRV